MKRKLKLILFLLMSINILPITKVRANTYTGKFNETYKWIPNTFIRQDKGGEKRYQQLSVIARKSDNQFVYCIEPGMELNGNTTYHGQDYDQNIVANMSEEQWDRIQLLMYYGYGYSDGTINHNDLKWYAVTQFMIWKTAPLGYDVYFTDVLNGKRITRYANEIQEMENLLAKHYVTPNFGETDFDISLGDTLTLTDTMGVLSRYSVESNEYVTTSQNGNNLFIKANKMGNTKLSITDRDTKYSHPSIVYYDSHSQNIAQVGSYDPVTVSLKITINGVNIKVIKVDSETNTCTPQGQASLSGAKYDIFDSNNHVVSHLTIGSDCTAVTDYLPLGHYTIKEVEPSTGYQLDDTIYTFDVNSNETVDVIVKEHVIKGRIKINKVDAETNMCESIGKATLNGAVYEIFDKNNNVVDTLTIGEDCTVISKELPYGSYTVKEKTPSTGYTLDENTYNVTINQDTTVEVTSKEEIQKGIIKLTKVDSETNACIPQGQATLIGAMYEILDWNNTVVDTLTIGEDCTASSKLLPLGEYTVREKTPSTGYYISNRISHVNITNALEYPVTVEEDVIKNYINILKQYDYVDGNSTLLDAEPNITFEILYPNGQKYSQITTDKNGHATINMPYGRWTFHQVNSHDGFSKVHDFVITVDETTPKEHYYNILNNKLSAYLQIVKKDKETGKTIALPNTSFKILNIDTNTYVSQFVAGIVYSTFKTDEKGIATTYLKLEAGNYRIVEVEAPEGYLMDNEGVNFTIGSDTEYKYTNYGTFIVIDFENTPVKGRIEIKKKGEKSIFENGKIQYEKIPLQDVEFKIYADEEITSSDGQNLYYKKGELVSTLYTNEDGYAISDLLPLGKYYLIETKTSDKHVLDTTKYHFILQSFNNNVAVAYETYTSLNCLKKGTLEFTKADFSTDEALSNTKIQIFTEHDELVFEGITDDNGKIIIEKLPYGKYYIVESEAPEGYLVNEERMHFEIKENLEVIKTTMKDEKITGTLEFTKTDFSTDKTLPNTKMQIFTEHDELVFEGITDDNGKIIIEKLPYGKYYIVELEAPEGYLINEERMYFEIKENLEVIKTTMKDEKITGTLEFTKTDFSTDEALPNTKMQIFTEHDELIFEGITDSNGKIIIEKLSYGKYYIVELEAPEGYLINEERMYFEIRNNQEVVKATLKDKKIKSTVIIHKVDEHSNTIEDVMIGIYDLEGNLLYSGKTNSNGDIEVELEYGTYYFQEISTVDGYKLSDKKIYFDITVDGEYIEKTLVNETVKIEIPDTFKNDYLPIKMISLIFIGTGLLIYGIFEKKNKK